MRFYSSKKCSYIPKCGDVRIIDKFTLIPILLGDYWIWLEKVSILQTYLEYAKFEDGFIVPTGHWEDTREATIEDYGFKDGN